MTTKLGTLITAAALALAVAGCTVSTDGTGNDQINPLVGDQPAPTSTASTAPTSTTPATTSTTAPPTSTTTTVPPTTAAPPTTSPPTTTVSYKNCDEVRAAGAAPIRRGDPGYSENLDRDGDGIGCE